MPEDTKTPFDLAERAGEKVVTLREAKRLISQRLRDPHTDSKSFTHLLVLLAKWHTWKRKPRREEGTQDEDPVQKLVLQMEREERLKRAGV